jgi:hypothetical protein
MSTAPNDTRRPRRGRLQDPPAEYVDLSGLEQRFNIRRTLAYQLIKEGKIRSIIIQKPGTARGRRLIDLASLRAYLASLS